jgi:hypothetical protein
MAFLSPEVRLSMRSLRIIVVAVFISHALIGFLLYRWRVVSQTSLAGSDWIIFGIPFWVASAAYFLAFTFSPYLRPRSVYRCVGLTVLSIAGAVFCWFFYMFFAANTYGT